MAKGYSLHALVISGSRTARIEHLLRNERLDGRVVLHEGDLADGDKLGAILEQTQPDGVYNLGGVTNTP